MTDVSSYLINFTLVASRGLALGASSFIEVNYCFLRIFLVLSFISYNFALSKNTHFIE